MNQTYSPKYINNSKQSTSYKSTPNKFFYVN